MEAELTIEEGGSVGNTLELIVRKGHCSISLEHPWYGDSNSGFGATLTNNLKPDDALRLGQHLIAWAKTENK